MKNVFLFIALILGVSLQAQRTDISRLRPAPNSEGQVIISQMDGGRLKWVPGTPVSPSYSVVDSLPDSLAVGEIVLYNGTLWRGLLEGESSLAAGTPWPVKGYKEYVALLTQTGTDAPVATVLSNTLGGTLVWSRFATEVYRATLTNAFPSLKTVCFTTVESNDFVAAHIGRENYGTDDYLQLYMPEGQGVYISLEIRVYPPN